MCSRIAMLVSALKNLRLCSADSSISALRSAGGRIAVCAISSPDWFSWWVVPLFVRHVRVYDAVFRCSVHLAAHPCKASEGFEHTVDRFDRSFVFRSSDAYSTLTMCSTTLRGGPARGHGPYG